MTADQVHVGHDLAPTEGDVAGWVQDASADVATSETRTLAAYGNLATTGPTVTVQVTPARPNVRVTISADVNPAASAAGFMSFAVDVGAASDANGATTTTTVAVRVERTTLVTGLSFGLHTFQAKYRSDGAAATTFANRRITARAEA